jgi:serine O-acetyltransferase
MFLYLLSNTIWGAGKDAELAGRVYYLNKVLGGIDVYYEVALPDIFLFVHCIGTVLGRASYSDYFVCYQRCTVGGNKDLEYPRIGKGVVLYGGSSVIGNCQINDNCLISAGTIVIDKDIPKGSVVFNRYRAVACKPTRKGVRQRYFL